MEVQFPSNDQVSLYLIPNCLKNIFQHFLKLQINQKWYCSTIKPFQLPTHSPSAVISVFSSVFKKKRLRVSSLKFFYIYIRFFSQPYYLYDSIVVFFSNYISFLPMAYHIKCKMYLLLIRYMSLPCGLWYHLTIIFILLQF